MSSAAASRTTLYVPGDRPDRFDKALAAGADAIILDLEDAVAEPAKDAARDNVASWLRSKGAAPAWVRVNNRPDLLPHDLAMVRELVSAGVSPAGVIMPKADVTSCGHEVAGLPVMALIESAVGVVEADAVAQLPAVVRLALGEADLAADLGVDPSPDDRELWAVRSRVVVASAAAGLPAPCGPVPTDLDDMDRLATSSETLRRQGFGGRSVIHPTQVAAVNAAFTPSASELESAHAVVDAFDAAEADGSGVAVVDGEFVDAAVVRRARATIARAGGPDAPPP